ncbi:aspartate aminotransferase family protein [Pseudonocardiaceae bacterium YIM PH 21723]|nr:aspartate aminotransferase family protein [Pseudonocardiaceae bacterium YIM PH 21723]
MDTYQLDRAHVFHSWSAQRQLDPMVVSRAEGVYVWDDSDRRYLDFSSQLVFTNIGHQHPKVVEAIQQQAAKLCTVAPHAANDARSEAARLIAEVAPENLNKVFFTNGGTEAVEHAVRLARLHTGRFKVLSQYRSYHGATGTSITLTGDPRRWRTDNPGAGAVHFFGPFLYRSAFHAETEQQECARALENLERTIQFEGPETIAAIILESVPGTAGILVPPAGWLAGVREICDRYGIVYIADEVMAGFGRTGRWLALDHFDARPDLITFAKGVNSGYVPLGGVIISDAIAEDFADVPYPGGLTYSGHPLACAAAVATLNVMRDEGIVQNADRIGHEVLGPGLRELAERHPSVGEVRGLGVFWALDLVSDPETREPLSPLAGVSPAMKEVIAACKENGLLIIATMNRLQPVPPCVVTDEQVADGLAILDKVLDVADKHVKA